MIDWAAIAKAHWDAQPHPQAPSLTVADYRVAVQLATAAKFGGHASPQEATAFWHEYAPLRAKGVSPDDFLQLLDVSAKVSFAFHGRAPTMPELHRFWDEKAGATKHPNEVFAYYQGLPDQQYPHVSAGDMVKRLEAAKPHARAALGRDPLKNEAAYLHHSGASPQQYYQDLAAELNPEPPPVQPTESPQTAGAGAPAKAQ